MVDVHPCEPEGFDVLIERFGDVVRDVGMVSAEDVVELRNSTGGEDCGGPGTRGHTEAAEQEIELAVEVFLESDGFVTVAATDVSTKDLDGGASNAVVCGGETLFEL